MIKVEIVKDSINPNEERLVTFLLSYPRMIHSELMTHCMLARNAASSRAIPFARMVRMIEEEPAMPEKWGAAQKGMQSGDVIEDVERAKEIWLSAMRAAINHATLLDQLGLHKSISNRIMEPWAHITTIVSGTEWTNFFKLRYHPAAEPTFQVLAREMFKLYATNEPEQLGWGEWHLPFVEGTNLGSKAQLAVSVAACARVSYMKFNVGNADVEKDIELHDKLAGDGHWSPFEHPACAVRDAGYSKFQGWSQYRKQFRNEDGNDFDLGTLMAQLGLER